MKLKVSIAQIDIRRADPEANLEKGERYIRQAAAAGSHIVCFPELWTTGLDWEYNANNAKKLDKHNHIIAGMARKHKICVTGSTVSVNGAGKATNTAIFFDKAGKQAARYDKAHLFGPLGEHRHMARGNKTAVADTAWGKLGFSVCYDIRFPELFRMYALKGVHIMFCPACFAYPRMHHWVTLTRARAIENQFFMVAVNRVGKERFAGGKALEYFGRSMAIDPWGDIICDAGERREGLFTAALDMGRVKEIRESMPALRDRRPGLYKL